MPAPLGIFVATFVAVTGYVTSSAYVWYLLRRDRIDYFVLASWVGFLLYAWAILHFGGLPEAVTFVCAYGIIGITLGHLTPTQV